MESTFRCANRFPFFPPTLLSREVFMNSATCLMSCPARYASSENLHFGLCEVSPCIAITTD